MTTFQEAVRTQDFTLTVQLQLAQQTDRDAVMRQADIVGPLVDAIGVPSNPGGSVHISALAASSLLIQKGIDPIMQMHCLHSNNPALRSA